MVIVVSEEEGEDLAGPRRQDHARPRRRRRCARRCSSSSRHDGSFCAESAAASAAALRRSLGSGCSSLRVSRSVSGLREPGEREREDAAVPDRDPRTCRSASRGHRARCVDARSTCGSAARARCSARSTRAARRSRSTSANVRAGRTTFKIDGEMLTLPRGVRVVRVEPFAIAVRHRAHGARTGPGARGARSRRAAAGVTRVIDIEVSPRRSDGERAGSASSKASASSARSPCDLADNPACVERTACRSSGTTERFASSPDA